MTQLMTDLEAISTMDAWKVMIVDDEEEVHSITRLVMEDFRFENKPLEFISAYSSKQAQELILENKDTALILLDVVMEEDNSGLKFVEFVREELGNNLVRIILRTGQPGQAPEEKVIVDYDINDYAEKTELTVQRLNTSIISALRSYRDIKTIESHNNGLKSVVHASTVIIKHMNSLKDFGDGILEELPPILGDENPAESLIHSLIAYKIGDEFRITSGTGSYSEQLDKNIFEAVDPDVKSLIDSLEGREDVSVGLSKENHYLYHFNNDAQENEDGAESYLYIRNKTPLTRWELNLLNLYCANIGSVLDNYFLHKEIEANQRELLFTISEVAETRSRETGNHVRRVAICARLLGLKHGLEEQEADLLYLASTMHDIGKLAIPDAILNKPGKLTPEEYEIMKTHTTHGYNILKNSKRKVMKYASIVAHQHQEKFDGTGYPQGLKGEDIHLFARLTTVVDVFDALASKRVYKDSWELEEILDFYKTEKGKHFDPILVDLFFDNLEDILAVREQYIDVAPE